MVAAVAEPGAVAAGGRPLLVVHRAVGFWYLGDGGPELGAEYCGQNHHNWISSPNLCQATPLQGGRFGFSGFTRGRN